MSATLVAWPLRASLGEPNLTWLYGVMLRASCVLRGGVCGVGLLRGQDCVPSAYQAKDVVMSHLEASLTATDADVSASASAFAEGLCSAVSAARLQLAARTGPQAGDRGVETVVAAKAAAVVTWRENGRFIWLLAAQGALIATWELQGSCSSTSRPVASF